MCIAVKWNPGAIGILGDRVVSPYAFGYSAKRVVDGKGMYALPGFIDTHVHIDSTLLTPEHLSTCNCSAWNDVNVC